MDEKLYVAFAKFEEGCREYERARTIYKYALDHIPKQEAQDLFKSYTRFEKKFGDRAGIEDVIISKRKFQYEEEVKENPMNYDAWFDYVRLMESEGSQEATREVYERAIANIPPSQVSICTYRLVLAVSCLLERCMGGGGSTTTILLS